MEVIRTIGSVMGSIKMLVDLIAKNREVAGELATDLESMNSDFELMTSLRLEGKEAHQLQLQELAYDIDDFIQDLRFPGLGGSFALMAIGVDSRILLVQRVKVFKERITNLKGELQKSYESVPTIGADVPAAAGQSSSSVESAYTPEEHLVGIHGPKMEIKQLLSRHVEPHKGRSGVISIVGRRGSGKTALARAIYNDGAITEDFDYALWVVASDHKPGDILNKILQQLPQPNFLKDRRYLVFVDDMLRGETCADIKKAFHDNNVDSRIIVTTRVPSVAMECSFGSFAYTMQGLDKEKSTELLCRKFWEKDGYSEEDKIRLGNMDVDFIVDKCDGLPIALISAAECLRRKSKAEPKHTNFITVSQELGDILACSETDFENYKEKNGNETTFVEMRRAFVEPYENLLSNGEKDCLLYVSIFPSGYQIKSKTLVRILIAEGLSPNDPREIKDLELVVSDVCECLRMLMDQHMIDPVPMRSNCNAAKKCQVHSVMMQFIIKKAVSRNLVSLIREGTPQRSLVGKVRRLTIQSSSDGRGTEHPVEMENLSVLRSLAIFNKGIVNFKYCKLVRVLNLDGFLGLTPKDLDNICGLLLLKYLSLRKTGIQELPENVKNLQCLETLDTRDTVVIKLPVEVIMLPRFAYMFGQFELTNVERNKKELIKFFSRNRSQLRTLGGIAVHETRGLETVLLVVEHATKLKKVKVWYRHTQSSTGPVTTSTPAVSGTPEVPHAGPLVESNSNSQGTTLTTSTPVSGGTSGLPSAEPSVDSGSNAQDPTPAISKTVADGGTPDLIPGANGTGLSTHKWYTLQKLELKSLPTQLFRNRKLSAEQSEARKQAHKKKFNWSLSKWKLFAGPAANPTSNTHEPAPATTRTVSSGTPVPPCGGPLADSNNNAQGPAPTTSTSVPGGSTPDLAATTLTPLARDTPELIDCVSRLTEALKNHPINLESLSIDFNGVSNTFLNFLQINGTISSIKLRWGQKSLPGPLDLGKVSNLKKLHLFSTGLKSDELGALQHLKCLQYLKLAEEGHGLWDGVFHVQRGGFISLIWLCFEASNSLHPPLKIDEGVKTPLTSLLLLCKEGNPRVEGISHLAKLNEVILHPSASDDAVMAWREEAKKHINRPYVEKQQV